MNSRLCDELGIEFPLFAFSHCRDVIAAVTNAGGFGVLGAAGHSPATLDIELNWIDTQVGGKSYGVDLLIPTSMDSKEHALTAQELEDRIPERSTSATSPSCWPGTTSTPATCGPTPSTTASATTCARSGPGRSSMPRSRTR